MQVWKHYPQFPDQTAIQKNAIYMREIIPSDFKKSPLPFKFRNKQKSMQKFRVNRITGNSLSPRSVSAVQGRCTWIQSLRCLRSFGVKKSLFIFHGRCYLLLKTEFIRDHFSSLKAFCPLWTHCTNSHFTPCRKTSSSKGLPHTSVGIVSATASTSNLQPAKSYVSPLNTDWY